MPDFNSLKPVEEGIINNISLVNNKSVNHFGFVFDGYIEIPKDGVYTFYISSDDGSCLYIDDNMIIENDGQQAVIEKYGMTALKKGYHSIRILFFENSGGEDLKVYIKGPEIVKQPIPNKMLFYVK